MTQIRFKAGIDHPHYYNASRFGGTNITPPVSTPSDNVQGCFRNANNLDRAFVQLIDDTYRTITYNAYEHIMKAGMGLVAGGERNEGTYNSDLISEGNTVRYTCYHKLPASFADDAPTNRFQLVQQWHNQNPVGSPPHHLAYGNTGSQRLLQPKFFGVDITNPSEMVELFLNTWVRVDTEIKWSSSSSGFMKVYRNKVLVCTRTGQTMNSGDLPYWKFGLYRDAALALDNSIWTKGVSQTIIG